MRQASIWRPSRLDEHQLNSGPSRQCWRLFASAVHLSSNRRKGRPVGMQDSMLEVLVYSKTSWLAKRKAGSGQGNLSGSGVESSWGKFPLRRRSG
jgi:hypothetical protein